MIADISAWASAAPAAFMLGVLVGLALASRYRIVSVKQRPNDEEGSE